MMHPRQWMEIRPAGLYCIPGQCYIDPIEPVDCALITHSHSDHARSGHKTVIAHPDTLAIMKLRYGDDFAQKSRALDYFQKVSLNDIELYLLPAGHVLGSAQLVIEFAGQRLINSGDYKRAFDPTCPSFIAEACDVFITEATFSLPIFKHPPIEQEIKKLLVSMARFSDRCHLIGVYALGKCQRLIKTLRALGYEQPIYLHGALQNLCNFYQSRGIELGQLKPASELDLSSSKGTLVLCPPSALRDRWSRRFANVIRGMASGWMQIRARAKQKGIELPLVISDHADWFELTSTLLEVNPKEVWITHGQEEALFYYATQKGYKAMALHLLGYDEEED